MTLLPSWVPQGTVTGQFDFVSTDGTDTDPNPELFAVTGTVDFTCSASPLPLKLSVPSHNYIGVVPLSFSATFDSEGYLGVLQGDGTNFVRGIELPATDSTLFNPSGFTWHVEFNLRASATGYTVNLPAFDISVPTGGTVDLITVMPVSSANGVPVILGPAGPTGPQGPAGDVSTWKPNTVYTAGQPVVNASGDVVTAIAAHTSGASYTAANWALSTTYAPIGGRRPGNLFVFLGDSLTLGSEDVAGNSKGPAWPVYASIISGQKIRHVRNAGVAGNTTAQMLARFDTDVTPYAPTVVTLACGTNDTGVTDFVTWQGQVKSIIAKIRAIGAVPILVTMPPNNLSTPTPDRQVLVNQWNNWTRLYAGQQGIPLVDMYATLVDPSNGNYLAAYYSDGTHPNAAGYAAMGQKFSDTITPILAPYAPKITQDDIDEPNLIHKGCFTGYSGTTLPTGWIDTAGSPTGSALSYTTDSAVPGQLFTITSTASSALRQISFNCNIGSGTVSAAASAGATTITISNDPSTYGTLFLGSGSTAEIVKVNTRTGSAGAWVCTLTHALRYAHAAGETVIANGAVGDKLLLTGLVTTDGGIPVRVGISPTGSSATARAMSDLPAVITRGVFLCEYTIATGTTNLNAYLQIAAGTGTVSYGQIGFYNLTRLGLV